jgi:hypothetical protein
MMMVAFDYGTTTDYLSTTGLIAPVPGPFRINLSDYEPSTTYHFRAKAIYSEGSVYGEDSTFIAPSDLLEPKSPAPGASADVLSVSTIAPPTDITSVSAGLQGALTSLGSDDKVQVGFEYGADAPTAQPQRPRIWIQPGISVW